MFSKGPQVRTILLVALFIFNTVAFSLDDDGQLIDDPGAIDSTEYNEDTLPPEVDSTDDDMNQAPEHAEYPIEETHQVLKYVQERADATKYSREPKVILAPAPIAVKKPQLKKPIKIKKWPTKKRPKTRHSK